MAVIKPIKALRYTEKAGELGTCVCPPYDIISDSERQQLLDTNPYNLVRLELPVGEDRYAKAGETLKQWLADGILARDTEEGIFVYREEFSVEEKDYFLTGIICRVRLCEFSERVVLPHEETLTKAKTDRFNLMCATNCNFSSVYSLYNDESGVIAAETDKAVSEPPVARFCDSEGVTHTLWKITDSDSIARMIEFFADKQLFIADGHHRYETALNYKKHLQAQGTLDGSEADSMMMTLVATDDPGLVVFPTHRMIVDMPVCRDELAKKCCSDFEAEVLPLEKMSDALKAGAEGHTFALYTGGDDFLLLTAKPELSDNIIENRSRAYSDLDVSILHYYVLERALGIDRENMANQINLRYTRSLTEALDSVREGKATASFIINATKVSQIKAVSLAGDKMPQKSTYFYPKLKTGPVMNILDK